MALDLGAGISGIGAGVSQLMGAEAYEAEAEGYRKAAAMSKTMGNISKSSTKLQVAGERKKIFDAKFGQQNDIAASGFSTKKGTSWFLKADTVSQGALALAIIRNQGSIEYLGYKTQATLYKSQAEAAEASADAARVGGALGILGGVLSMFSDPALKHDIVEVGADSDGRKVYEFSYVGSNERFRGYMADELPKDAVNEAAGVARVTDRRYRARKV